MTIYNNTFFLLACANVYEKTVDANVCAHIRMYARRSYCFSAGRRAARSSSWTFTLASGNANVLPVMSS